MFSYVYQYSDHLGSVRLSYTDVDKDGLIDKNTEIVEESNYYPFGLKHKGYNDITSSMGNSLGQKLGFEDKELNDDFVDGNNLDWYGFGARNNNKNKRSKMVINNKIIDSISYSELDGDSKCCISNSIINTIDFDYFESKVEIIIENCLIYNLSIHSCWFTKGLVLKNNHILSYVDYQMGGHNENPIYILGNVFTEFINFFDCQFNEEIIVEGNVFSKGTNLLGNLKEGFENSFNKGVVCNNNVGELNLDGVGNIQPLN